jgi:peptide/nickel transport system permease protein
VAVPDPFSGAPAPLAVAGPADVLPLSEPVEYTGRHVTRRGKGVAAGVGLLVLGVIAFVVSTAVLTDATAVVRLAVAAVGALLVFYGIDRIGNALANGRFETGFWISSVWLIVVVLSAIFVNFLPLAEYKDVSKTLTEPTLLRPDLFSNHPLGTDRQGLDILGGVIYGARISLTVGLGGVIIGLAIGGVVGMLAGYYRGKVDGTIGLFTDSMLAFPPLILLFGMVAVLKPSVTNVTLALALLGIPTYIRLSRANTLAFSQREFVLAARALGARHRSIIFRELLPNVALPLISYGFIIVAALIVAEASLSFLGLGIQRPTPTWGNMIAAGQSDFERHPHLVFIPGTILFATVFALNKVGDKARRVWDPRRSAL